MATLAWIQPFNPVALDWAARVVVNGGAAPAITSVAALSTFWSAIQSAGIDSKMLSVMCYSPDNLIASITPLYKTVGNDPWTNTGPFVSGDLTTGGLTGDGTSKYLKTGIIPNTHVASVNSVGLTVYSITASDAITVVELGCASSGTAQLEIYFGYSGVSYWDAWNTSNGRISAANSLWSGFLSGNRTAVNAAAIYRANSGNAFNTLVSGSVSNTGTRSTNELYAHCTNSVGTPLAFSTRQISFMAVHAGLTSGEAQSLYNAVQTMRTALGGGYV